MYPVESVFHSAPIQFLHASYGYVTVVVLRQVLVAQPSLRLAM